MSVGFPAGCLKALNAHKVDSNAKVRHRVVDFRPPTGRVLCTQAHTKSSRVPGHMSMPPGSGQV